MLLVLTSVTVITLDYRDQGEGILESLRSGARDAFAPVQSAADRVFAPVGDLFGGATRYRRLKAENVRLRSEIDRARGDTVRGADADRERQILFRLQGLPFAGDLAGVTARVVSEAPSNFQLTVALDRGEDDGVGVGMPVVTEAGLVGRVIEASRSRTTVLLLTDPSSSVGVRLTGSGELGAVTGAGPRSLLPLDLVSVETRVTEGEGVVTSGLQRGLFPPQVPVGRVRGVRVPPGELEQEVMIEPLVDLRRLEFVRVLLWRPSP